MWSSVPFFDNETTFGIDEIRFYGVHKVYSSPRLCSTLKIADRRERSHGGFDLRGSGSILGKFRKPNFEEIRQVAKKYLSLFRRKEKEREGKRRNYRRFVGNSRFGVPKVLPGIFGIQEHSRRARKIRSAETCLRAAAPSGQARACVSLRRALYVQRG